ncbi:hypothetical protein KP509_19G073000 [Ceratopteris richardii]|uniref:PPM-type phosphatase domain-containing protein n=1 Tax=Ceratopteris richardii TaxID=49495 RepID=A0A8T2SNJ5_CERRI|nr:hypothetical protein KP509_19G073000 [Ceratopteris richardii]
MPPRTTMTKPSEVQVELYVRGKGPLHVFKEVLVGWDHNHLDSDHFMHRYKLKALYPFSLSNGRGIRLFPNPRNGLSTIAYSGRSDVLIKLDGEPSDFLWFQLAKVLSGLFLVIGLACLALADSLPGWLSLSNENDRSHIVILVCFITMLYSQLVWKPMWKNKFISAGYIPGVYKWKSETPSEQNSSESRERNVCGSARQLERAFSLWDVISNQDACLIARRCLATKKDAQVATTTFLQEAHEKGSSDNISVVVIDLKHEVAS